MIKNNSEILYVYYGRLVNPNGDPDMDNMPRLDVLTGTNLSSDLRIKRDVREFWEKSGFKIFYSREGIKRYAMENGYVPKANEYAKMIIEKESIEGETTSVQLENLFKNYIDLRVFGAMIPSGKKNDKKGKKQKKDADEDTSKEEKEIEITIPGPVQFSWQQSPIPVEIVKSNTITAPFAGREAEKGPKQGTMGKRYQVYFTILPLYGTVSRHNSDSTCLKDSDLKWLDYAFVNMLYSNISGSKIGRYPLLYMRIEYNDEIDFFMGDLREYLNVEIIKEPVRSIKDIKFNFGELMELINKYKDKIKNIYLYKNDLLDKISDFSSGFKEMNDKIRDIKKPEQPKDDLL